MLIALVLRFDLMMSYGSITGPVLSCASLFCMLLYFVTTVDSGRWVLSNSKVSLSDDVIFFKSHTWQPGFRLPCKQWTNIHLAPSATSLVRNCWGENILRFRFFFFCCWKYETKFRWWQAPSFWKLFASFSLFQYFFVVENTSLCSGDGKRPPPGKRDNWARCSSVSLHCNGFLESFSSLFQLPFENAGVSESDTFNQAWQKPPMVINGAKKENFRSWDWYQTQMGNFRSSDWYQTKMGNFRSSDWYQTKKVSSTPSWSAWPAVLSTRDLRPHCRQVLFRIHLVFHDGQFVLQAEKNLWPP